MEKQWPAGLSVLAVDNDPQVLAFIKKVCSQCHYNVTICSESPVALNLVWERKDWIDVVLMEVHMPHMDGCEFLRHVRYQINIPVIIMSRDSDTSSVMKAIKFGACDYWIKPLHECQFKNMWTHVVKKILSGNKVQTDLGSLEYDDRRKRGNYNSEPASSDVDESEPCGSSSKKRARVIWSPQLHREFVKAVNQIGLDQAVPKKIHELMNNPALTRDSVASHLQKYRHYLKSRSNRVTQTQTQTQTQQQHELALADNVPRTIEYRVGTSGTFHLAATRPVTYHRAVASLSPGMIPNIENQSDPSTHAEQGLGCGQTMGKYAFANDNANNFHQSDPNTRAEQGLGYGQMMGKYAFANDNANNFHPSVRTVDIEQQPRHQQIPVQHSLSVVSENTFHFNRYTSSASKSQQLQNSGFTSGAVRSSPASVSPESSPSGFTIKDNTTEDSSPSYNHTIA